MVSRAENRSKHRRVDWLDRQEKVDFDFVQWIRTTTFDCLGCIRERCTIRKKTDVGLEGGEVQENYTLRRKIDVGLDGEVQQEDYTTSKKNVDCGGRPEVDRWQSIFVDTAVGAVEWHRSLNSAVEEVVGVEVVD